MGKYWRLMAEYDSETTAYTEAAGAFATSPYTPDENARLIGLRTTVSAEAATSLTENIQWKLTSTSFVPNSIECGSVGHGLHTAPMSAGETVDWVVDQQVKSGVKITIEARNITAETPVTVESYLWGLFEA